MRFAVSVSRELTPTAAGFAVGQAVRRELGGHPPDLAFLFFSSHYAERADKLAAAVRGSLAPRVLLGCTGEGVIGGTEEIEVAPAVALWGACLPDAHLVAMRLSCLQSDESPVTGWPEELGSVTEPPVCVLLADPFSSPMDEVLMGLADRSPGSAAIGGLAGGGREAGEHRLVLDEKVYDGGLVGVAVSGPVTIRTVISQGCRPIGERFVVTRAEHNVIHELGGAPALQRLKTLLEELDPETRGLAQRALHLGIVMDEQRNRFERGDFLVRNLIGVDRSSGSLAIGDLIREGQTVQFHVRDARSASEDLHLLLAAERSRHRMPPLGALLFSCCGRGRGLFGHPHHDVAVLRERAGAIPVAGFFAQGEIGPVGGRNFLHGYTASVALFSEPAAAGFS